MADLRIEYTPLTKLLPAARNAKLHDRAGIRASIERFGFAEPLVINETTGRLVAGHGRLVVLQELKANGAAAPQRIQVKGKEWLVPVVRGLAFASEQEAEAYCLAANQLTIAGGWNEGMLLEQIAEMHAANVSFVGIGFDQTTIDSALREYAQVAAETWENSTPVDHTPTPLPAAPAPSGAAPSAAAPIPAPPPTAAAAAAPGAPAPAPTAAAAAPAPASVVAATAQAEALAADAEEEDGILDPINRDLTKGEYGSTGECMRFMRYSVPLTVAESAQLERAIEDWVHQTGGMFGFVHNLMKKAGY